MYFPLFFPLRAETRESFLLPVDHLIQQSGGVAFRFPRRVGVDVHCGTDIRVSQQFLHVLRSRPIGQEVAREGVAEHMEMEVRQAFYLPLCLAAHDAHRTRRLYRSIRPETDEGNLLVPLRRFLYPGQGVDLVIDAVFLPDLGVVVEAVEFTIAQAVLALFPPGRFEDRRQRVAEVHSTDFLPLGGPDLRLVPRPVVADAPPYREIESSFNR